LRIDYGNPGASVENEVEWSGPVYPDFQNNQITRQLKRHAKRSLARSKTMVNSLRARVIEKWWTEQTRDN
jgi:hypothetical protein